MRRLILLIAVLSLLSPPVWAQELRLPLKPNSIRFAVIGDMGTGDSSQYETARRMVEARQRFPFEFVIMVGDNIYGASGPSDMAKKFEIPYKPLIDAGVPFYAALGNHDDVNERFYKYFNMNGKQYYTFKKGNVRFFALDSNYMTPEQQAWLVTELKNSGSQWKIAFFHHPLYSSGGRHGSSLELRQILEPLFESYKVQLVFQGHDHIYERVKPQGGTYYFTEGSSGQLRAGDLKRTSFTDTGFDTDRTFMLVEIAGDEMYFQTIARSGQTVDSGMIVRSDRQQTATTAPATTETPVGPREKEVIAQPENKPATSGAAESAKPTTTIVPPPEKSATGATTSTTSPPKTAATPSSTSSTGTSVAQSKPTATTTKAQKARSVAVKAKPHRRKRPTLAKKAPAKAASKVNAASPGKVATQSKSAVETASILPLSGGLAGKLASKSNAPVPAPNVATKAKPVATDGPKAKSALSDAAKEKPDVNVATEKRKKPRQWIVIARDPGESKTASQR